MSETEVIIVGGGVAGLCCGLRLAEAGVPFVLLEASDGVGGRVRTDKEDGFLLDRGFQVLLTAYPEVQRVLDLGALRVGSFYPGAVVACDQGLHRVADPWRHPFDALRSLSSPVGALSDKLRVARLRRRALSGSLDDLFDRPEQSTLLALRSYGFSELMIERFFRPFLGGIFLDGELSTSSRMLDFVFRMFSQGDTALPADGMQAIPDQIAAHLPDGSIRVQSRAVRVRPGRVDLEGGETVAGRTTVLAVEGPSARQLIPSMAPLGAWGVTCLYYSTDTPPDIGPHLLLNGYGRGPINNLCLPTEVCRSYAPPGQSLVSVTVLGSDVNGNLEAEVRSQAKSWFGGCVEAWRHLETYTIQYALPVQKTIPPSGGPSSDKFPGTVEPELGQIVCGDHVSAGSLQGAMVSGRSADERILASR